LNYALKFIQWLDFHEFLCLDDKLVSSRNRNYTTNPWTPCNWPSKMLSIFSNQFFPCISQLLFVSRIPIWWKKISKYLNKTFSLSFTKVYYLNHKLSNNWLKKTKTKIYNCKYSVFENNSLLQSLSSNSLKGCNKMDSIIFCWATIHKRH